MLQILLIALGVVIICAWLVVMRIWWNKEHHIEQPLSSENVARLGEKGARLLRRGWYRTLFYGEIVRSWGSSMFARAFFYFFPSAKPAFAKKDELVGLAHGPSSFFLKSISEKDRKKVTKR